MKFKKSHIYNLITLVIVILLIVPQTRKQIQIGLNKVVASFGPSINKDAEGKTILIDYNWTLMDRKGNEFDFESAKGKVILVNLWATWCPPCIAEMPSMTDLYKDYKDKVVFLFVSGEEVQKVNSFLEQRDLNIPSYTPISAYPADLANRSLPTTYILGKDGTIHVKKTGAANWNSNGVRDFLDELLME
jgi:thiol-disulfide isomerase/thioredoxin